MGQELAGENFLWEWGIGTNRMKVKFKAARRAAYSGHGVAGGSRPKNKELKKHTLKKTNIECCYPLLPLNHGWPQDPIDLAGATTAGPMAYRCLDPPPYQVDGHGRLFRVRCPGRFGARASSFFSAPYIFRLSCPRLSWFRSRERPILQVAHAASAASSRRSLP